MRTLWEGGPNDPEVVRHLQRLLNRDLSLAEPNDVSKLAVDGVYGQDTIATVEAFQAVHHLVVDGVVGPRTWAVLLRDVPVEFRQLEEQATPATTLASMVDIEWLHQWEDHEGVPYWPGGRSGVTLDPGFDLGQQRMARVVEVYGPLLTGTQLQFCEGAIGLKGVLAKTYLNEHPNDIKISEPVAIELFPQLLLPYWEAIARRFPVLETSPMSVRTVLLSLSYNRGAQNSDLEVLAAPLEARHYSAVGRAVQSMQANHELRGIRRRRQAEGHLILSSLR